MSRRLPVSLRLATLLLWLFTSSFTSTLSAQTSHWTTDQYGVRLAHGSQGSVGTFDFQDIDNVAVMTGALGLSIPLGQAYPAGGRLSYQLAANYGSNETEARMRTKCTPPPCENFAADVPYAMSQAGRGWLVHLGRLLEPDQLAEWRARSLDARDQGHNYHEEWIFVEADGTERHFHSTLHGEAASGALYTRDGSYYRLKIHTATSVSVELPDGIAYNFSRAATWPDSAFNRDNWRLQSITDLSGNAITLAYLPTSWTVTDRYGRVQTVKWEADPWFGGRIDEVIVTTFGGTTASYNFSYATVSFTRWNAFRTERITNQHGQLDKIARPDGAAYDFTYQRSPRLNSGFNITHVSLPSGGTLEYTYDALVLPSARDCDDPFHLRVAQDAVARRRVLSRGGATLRDTQYVRKVDDSPQVAANFCLAEGDIAFPSRPKAELVVGVLNPYVPGRSSLALNYFSVFPISRLGPNFGAGQTNWKSEDFGQPFTRDIADPDGRFLSIKLFDCAFDTWDPRDDVETKANQCVSKRSTFVRMEQDYSVCEAISNPDTSGVSRDATWRCLGTNAQMIERKIVYHDDGGHLTLDRLLDNDGFGHFRTQRLSGNIAPSGSDETREERVDYNPVRRELIRTASGEISPSSTWTILPSDQPWYVNGFVSRRVGKHRSDGLVFQHSEVVCYSPQTGLLNSVRIRADARNNQDGDHDVLYRFIRDSGGEPGLVTEIRVSGGDRQVVESGLGCNAQPSAQYAYRQDYQHGVLKRAALVSSTTTLVDHRSVDRNTGLPRVSWDASGNVSTTYTYDSLGRVTLAIRDAGPADTSGQPDDSFAYRLPGVNGWASAPQITQVTSDSVVLQRQVSTFDELRRELRREWLHPQSGEIAAVWRYRLDGALEFASLPQAAGSLNTNLGTSYVSDVFGRPLIVTTADGRVTTTGYRGVGARTDTARVGAVETAGGVGLADAITTTSYDRFGNQRVVATANHSTFFNYDSLDRVTWIGRGQQQRAMTYDGRGFMVQELVPELGSGAGNDGWIFREDFDALGQQGREVRPGSGQRFQYDTQGRLTRVSDAAGNPRLTLTYGDSGTGNGRIVTATRRNVWNLAASGGSLGDGGYGGVAEVLEVTHFNTYEAHGALRHRTTVVTPPFTPSILPTVHFDQEWEHDALGRTRRVGYPLCSFQSNVNCAANNPVQVRNVSFGWGPGGALRSVANSDTFVGTPDSVFNANFTYHPNGQLASIAHANGRTDWVEIDPNGMDRVGGLNLAGAAGSPVANGLLKLTPYLYDGAGRITQISSDRFVYDLTGRLAKALQPGTGGLTETYSYDLHDNFTQKGANAYSHSLLTNRNLAADITYDWDGRIVRSGPFKVVYDDLGLQISVVNNPNSVIDPCKRNTKLTRPGGCFMNVYGPDGRRVAVMEAGGPHGLNVRMNWTLRDVDGRVLRTFTQLQNSAATRTKDFIYGGRTLISAYGPPEAPIADGVRHYHVDHLGSPRVVTASDGSLLGTPRHYAPFGGNANTDTTGERIIDWAGYEEDSNGITHNLNARSYFNGWGRFLSPDPARVGWNLYAYAHNDPVNLIDPSGLEACNEKNALSGDCETLETITVTARDPARDLNEAIDRVLSESMAARLNPIDPSEIRSGAFMSGEVPPWMVPPSIRPRTAEDDAREMLRVWEEDFWNGMRAAGVLPRLSPSTAGIQFSQRGVSSTFRHGEFAGQTIESVAAGLRSGRIGATQVPVTVIVRDGVTYSLNNRSLVALRLAGLEPTVIHNVTGDPRFERQLTERLGEMGGTVRPGFVPRIRGTRR